MHSEKSTYAASGLWPRQWSAPWHCVHAGDLVYVSGAVHTAWDTLPACLAGSWQAWEACVGQIKAGAPIQWRHVTVYVHKQAVFATIKTWLGEHVPSAHCEHVRVPSLPSGVCCEMDAMAYVGSCVDQGMCQ